MKAFKLSGDEKRIYFQNLNRIPAEEEFVMVIKELQAAGFNVSKVQMMGLDDVYVCRKAGKECELYYDGEESFIYSENQELTEELMRVFAN